MIDRNRTITSNKFEDKDNGKVYQKTKEVSFNKNNKMVERSIDTYVIEPYEDFVSGKREVFNDKGMLSLLQFFRQSKKYDVYFSVSCKLDDKAKVYITRKFYDDELPLEVEKEILPEFNNFVAKAMKSIRKAIGKKPLVDEEVLKLCNGDVQKALKMMKNENQTTKGTER